MDVTRRPRADTELARLLRLVERGVTARLNTVLEPSGTNLEQWHVMSLLADGTGHPMVEIAEYTMLPPPTLTKVVDRMVSANLVYRRTDPLDRRRVLVHLAARGRATYRRLAERIEMEGPSLTGGLDADTLDDLATLLARLADGLGHRP